MTAKLPTEAVLAQENLRKERDRFVAFAFASADILLELDDKGSIIFADGATRGLLGHEPAALAGQSFYEMLPEADAEKARSVIGDDRGFCARPPARQPAAQPLAHARVRHHYPLRGEHAGRRFVVQRRGQALGQHLQVRVVMDAKSAGHDARTLA